MGSGWKGIEWKGNWLVRILMRMNDGGTLLPEGELGIC